ncbi:carboxylesterase family protein [Mycobacterium ulcerans str. Harvey]|uniref:Carboxylesterase family protein n=1 Tax=Mycobacterium ulcerans str. Harvey TaxID=1299332 RepID=A0ABN0R7P8_MYCUL|nr:carboxylesterase family protein [Mycobacterium ulcerans str. Harvey]
MFTQVAAEQPDLQLSTEEEIGLAYSRLRRRARPLSIATDVGFRMPSVWLAEGHSRMAPVYLYRFDYSTPLLKLLLVRAAHATELPYVWGNLGGPQDPTLRLGGAKTAKAVSKRMRTRWINFATQDNPAGPPVNRTGRLTRTATALAWSSTSPTGLRAISTHPFAPPGAGRSWVSGRRTMGCLFHVRHRWADDQGSGVVD